MNPYIDLPGAWDAFRDVPPSLSPISQNKTLYVAKLSGDKERTPDPVPKLTSTQAVMEHFKPQVEVTLNDEKGANKVEIFQFRKMDDFARERITKQSPLLHEMNTKIQTLQQMDTELRTNELLKNALDDPKAKQVLLSLLQQMIEEIDQAD